MKKILYIGHSFHKKTLSTEFFIEILKQEYIIDFIWTLPSSSKFSLVDKSFSKSDYFAIVFFQILPEESYLKTLKCQNIILVPMYDNDLMLPYNSWKQYSNYKFICFSKSFHEKLSFLGIEDSLYLQYAPPKNYLIRNTNILKRKVNIFLWQRSYDINWELIKKIIHKKDINSIHLHRIKNKENEDSWFEKPNKKDIIDFNITFSSWFETKDDLIKCINSCDIFIAPRFYEGIGQSFLEAMSLGKCVIAADFPTANEYIKHNINGLLYTPNSLKKLKLSNSLKLGEEAKKDIDRIRDIWEKDKNKILPFISIKKNLNNSHDIFYKNAQELKSSLKDKYKFLLDDLNIIQCSTNIKKPESMNFSKYLNYIHEKLSNLEENDIILYGAGTGAQLIISIIGSKIDYIVDKSEKAPKYLMNKKIYNVKKIIKERKKKIIITVFGREKEIKNYLINELNIPETNIITFEVHSRI